MIWQTAPFLARWEGFKGQPGRDVARHPTDRRLPARRSATSAPPPGRVVDRKVKVQCAGSTARSAETSALSMLGHRPLDQRASRGCAVPRRPTAK